MNFKGMQFSPQQSSITFFQLFNENIQIYRKSKGILQWIPIYQDVTVVSILICLFYYFTHIHANTYTCIWRTSWEYVADIICIVSGYVSTCILRVRILAYITTIPLSHLKDNNNATILSVVVFKPISILYFTPSEVIFNSPPLVCALD